MATDEPDAAPSSRAMLNTVRSRDNELEAPPTSHPTENTALSPLEDGENSQQREDGEAKEEEEGKICCCIKPGKPGHFSRLDVLFTFGGMITFIADIVLDLILAVQYLHRGQILWSAMTFIFVLLPSIVLQSLSMRWFVRDWNKEAKDGEKGILRSIKSVCLWVATHVLQLGPIRRYWRFLKFGRRSWDDKRYQERLIDEYRDITMLRVFEAFLESAPQLVLQLYIMVETHEFYWLTAISCVASLVSLSWALGAYHMALRNARDDKKKVAYLGVALIMAWRLFTITSRVIAMALFAAIYEWLIFVVGGVHWAIMTAWLIWQKTEFTESNKCEEGLLDTVIGFIHIFCFFNMKEGRTRFRALFFYVITFTENTIMFALWFVESESRRQMYGLPALFLVWGGFFIGIFIMLLYYRNCHPNGQMPVCVPCPKFKCPCFPRDEPDLRRGENEHRVPWPPRDRVNLFYYTSRRKIHHSILPTSSRRSTYDENGVKVASQEDAFAVYSVGEGNVSTYSQNAL